MAGSRKRQIVSRAVLAAATVVILPMAYFGSVLGIELAYGIGYIPYWFWEVPVTAVNDAPLQVVARTSPGTAKRIHGLMEASQAAGRRLHDQTARRATSTPSTRESRSRRRQFESLQGTNGESAFQNIYLAIHPGGVEAVDDADPALAAGAESLRNPVRRPAAAMRATNVPISR